MTGDLTKQELQHILQVLNETTDANCPVCSSARQKLEKMISGNYTEEKIIGGIPVTVEHIKG